MQCKKEVSMMQENVQYQSVRNLLPGHIEKMLEPYWTSDLQEIRLRIGQQVEIIVRDAPILIEYCLTEEDLKHLWENMTNYSSYAYEDQIRQGFITIQGGHRIGICGRAVYQNETIQTIRNIAFVNIRIARQVIDCSKVLINYICPDGEYENTLIISKPGYGKTTILRDLVRKLSYGEGVKHPYTVGVVDERSEIAASYMGKPQNDVGPRTDVLDCCHKADGMMMLIRAMRPDIVAVDELGSCKDAEAIATCSYCGCKILATIHGNSITDVYAKRELKNIFKQQVFCHFVVCEMSNTQRMWMIYDAKGNKEVEVFG